MKIYNDKTTMELIQSLETELAKAQNEIRCLRGDADKASGRVAFCLSVIHNLKKRDIKE